MQNSKPLSFGPNPFTPHPFPEYPRIGFLKNFIQSPLIEIGDYTYYDDPDGPERFEKENVLYHYDFRGDKLLIGKFCAIATGVKFIMNGANHKMNAFSTYPFAIFGNGWEKAAEKLLRLKWWDWSPEKITESLEFLTTLNFKKLDDFV
nr:hypothetical protein [Leptospira alstonii]